ncbi:flagellar biosynthesis regulator FlaF [Thioclava sp. GXIMD4216]|uniref:flagellar biosynthesis regulator FlaF n=1 Tax=unclassified Thioclava TaxID=2621713 RepID=UPI0030D338B9
MRPSTTWQNAGVLNLQPQEGLLVNAYAQAKTAYSTPNQAIRTDRDIEYEAIARITSRLRGVLGKELEKFPDLADAVNRNRKLWKILAEDVATSGNGLPDLLRARILFLQKFTDAHSSKVLARKASVAPLIEINTAIMRGLRPTGGAK